MHFLTAGFIFTVAVRSASSRLPYYCTECKCCVDRKCDSKEICIDGCIEGTAGSRCWGDCPSNCKGCEREAVPIGSRNPRLCTSCVDGKYLDQAKNCSICPEHCETCESATFCTKCTSPYYNARDVTDCSLYCPMNCEKCSPPGVCSKCKDEYYDIASGCTETCPSNCVSCNSLSDCTECYNGFYNGYVEDNTGSLSHNDCSLECRSSCTACSSYNNCSVCKIGNYGASCLNKCPHGCEDNICVKDIGHCVSCNKNFTGDKCDTCIDNYYTKDCSKLCPTNTCKYPTCDRIHGTCSVCIIGLFGEFCNNSCSSGCLHSFCNQTSGLCSLGCEQSFTGDKCCISNGHCETCLSNSECRTCIPGYYGNNCDVSCSENCDGGCDRTDGRCVNCKAGTYGTFCEHNCSVTCDGSCRKENGSCYFGCKGGYYGEICTSTCHNNCRDQICHQETGYCLQCVHGFEGTTCSQKFTKSSIVGPVAGGVIGFIVVVVLVIVLFFLKRRRNKNKDPGMAIAGTDLDNHIYSNDVVQSGVCNVTDQMYESLKNKTGSFHEYADLASVRTERIDLDIIDYENPISTMQYENIHAKE